ncbi:MAG TPA: BTAD domain-containing putative transcriptional regulator [Longimicrobiales bacterium]|nr:BTAD domain-containing putative transcriptional regulator [Longimicrobiales bacterium]
MGFHLRILGGLDLCGPDGGEVRSVLAHPKRFALLTYLAVTSPRGYRRRDVLLTLLWPDQDAEHARASLRQALHGLRRSLGDDALLTRADEVALAVPLFSCDVWAFEAAAAGKDDDTAAGLYAGELLPGFFLEDAPEFEQWVEAERARLRRGYVGVLERIARRCAETEPLRAVEVWRRLTEVDPYSSRFAVGLMRALEAAGDAPAAILHAERHATVMKEELDAEPDAEVAACAARLRQGGHAHVDAHPLGVTPHSALAGQPPAVGETPPAGASTRRVWNRWRTIAVVAVTGAIIAAAATLLRPTSWPSPSVARYALAFPEGQEPLNGLMETVDVGRGAKAIVYLGPGERGPRLWVKLRDRVDAYPLPETEGAEMPAISPDGLDVVFYSYPKLMKVPIVGGSVVTLADSALRSGVAWLEDGRLVYTGEVRGGGRGGAFPLEGIPRGGGPPTNLWPACPEGMVPGYPVALPGGRGLLVAVGPYTWPTSSLWVVDLGTGDGRELVPDVLRGWYLESGHIVYVRRNGTVFAAPFDARSLELIGPEAPLLEGVNIDFLYPDLALAPDGSLLMLQPPASLEQEELVWIARNGAIQRVDPDWRFASPRRMSGFALSPDGRRLAIGIRSDEGDDIWIKELDRGPLIRLTTDPGEDLRPSWTYDGESVLFISFIPGSMADQVDLYVRRADGTGAAEPVLTGPESPFDATMSTDGAWIVFRAGGILAKRGGRDLYAHHVGEDELALPLLTSVYDEVSPRLSPDGRWLAYASNESGSQEVYLRPFPHVDTGKWMVSLGGGSSPVWSHGGRELFYVSADREMMVARIRTEGEVQVIARSVLFEIPHDVALAANVAMYDVTPDDQRFIMARVLRPRLILIENFGEEVRRALPGRRR